MPVLASRAIAPGEGHAAGRALLRELYEARFGTPMPPILTQDRGKPCFADGSCHFSISHTKKHVFCALSHRPIGIDAEELDRAVNPMLAQKVLSPMELAQYEAAADKPRALLTFWVLKEAQAKLTGRGLAGYPNHTAFSLSDPRVTIMDGCLLAVMEEENHAL